jgi:hypothetical protein
MFWVYKNVTPTGFKWWFCFGFIKMSPLRGLGRGYVLGL